MSNSYFQFKQFRIEQSKCAMKVGTDGVLLGAWASVTDCPKKILDVGTGTGLVALMLAQRFTKAVVTAVEIDAIAASQATENVSGSPWNNRITVMNVDFLKFVDTEIFEKYDLIVSNPPYFSASLKSENKLRNTARHDDSLSLTDLFCGAKKIITDSGILSLILPSSVEAKALQSAQHFDFSLRRKTTVYPKKNSAPRRVLLEFSLEESVLEVNNLVIELEERHQYSEAYKKLTDDFYLEK